MNNFYIEAFSIYVALIILIYAFFLLKKTTAVVDTCWSLGHWLIGSWLLSHNPNPTIYNFIVYVALSLWAFRLSLYIYFTRVYDLKHIEQRYDELFKQHGQSSNTQFLKQITLQVTLIYILMAPFYISLLAPLNLNLMTVSLCTLIFLFGWVNEARTDWQRHVFRKSNKGILQEGWWRLSRHPNYFFEIVMWCAFTGYVIAKPYGYLTVISPALLVLLMLKVTIPVTEEYALKKNKTAYKKYQQTTSKLIPLPLRRN